MELSHTLILATSSEAHNQWILGSITCLIAGLIFVALGATVGWIIWKRYRAEADRLELENETLLRAYNKRNAESIKIRQLSAELVDKAAA